MKVAVSERRIGNSDFDRTDLGVRNHWRQQDGDLSIGDRDGECFVNGQVGAACAGNNVEVGKYGRAVDGRVEDALPRLSEVDLGKFQLDRIIPVGNRELVLQRSRTPSFRLIQDGRGRIGDGAGC